MSDVKPGDVRKATITGKTYDQVWTAAETVADEHFEVRERDKATGVIKAERTMSAFSKGEYIGIYIVPLAAAATHTVEVVRRKKSTYGDLGERDWEYKGHPRCVYRMLNHSRLGTLRCGAFRLRDGAVQRRGRLRLQRPAGILPYRTLTGPS